MKNAVVGRTLLCIHNMKSNICYNFIFIVETIIDRAIHYYSFIVASTKNNAQITQSKSISPTNKRPTWPTTTGPGQESAEGQSLSD